MITTTAVHPIHPARFSCTGPHRYFVVDVAVVQSKGFVKVIAMCTSCGDWNTEKFQITEANEAFVLKSPEHGEPSTKKDNKK